MKTDTTSQEFFDAKYRHQSDPWNFAGDAYETLRYQTTLAALAPHRYGRAFEPGCSIGVLTAKLAVICDHVLAMDIAPTAVDQARARCREFKNVEVVCGALPQDLPQGSLDLIVLSEVGYYLSEDRLQTLGKSLVQKMPEGGILLAVHWLGKSEDHCLSGDRVHEILGTLDGLDHRHGERHLEYLPGFRLDLWAKRQVQS